ncbi:MAG: FkbM family methyltransferase [Longimicrobiales bacterium]
MIRAWWGFVRSLVVYGRPGRQRGLRRFYAPFVGPGDLVFDVGAHVGDRTAAFAALGARVVAVEPQPRFARWLRRRVGRAAGVTVLEEALGAAPGTARLAVSDATPTLSTLADAWRERVGDVNPGFRSVRWDRGLDVPVTTLDRLIEEHGVPRFVKIDVEGYEAEVLTGLSVPVDALSVEFVAGTLDGAIRCVDRLRDLDDYRWQAVAGERRTWHWGAWRAPHEVRAWLEAGADGLASGDLYARRATLLTPARP